MRSDGALGVVVLTNEGGIPVDDIGMALLNPLWKLPSAAIPATERELQAARARTVMIGSELAQNLASWGRSDGLRENALRIEDDALCVNIEATRGQRLFWPVQSQSPLRVERGRQYSVFFRTWASGALALRLQIAVRHRVERPNGLALLAESSLSPSPALYRVDFVPEQTDEDATLELALASDSAHGTSTFCLRDVVLALTQPALDR